MLLVESRHLALSKRRIQKSFFQFRQFYAQFSLYAQSVNSPDNLKKFYENSNELKTETAKLESLLEQYNDIPEAYNLYAQILSEQEHYEKAEKYYQFSLEKDPSNAALTVQRVIIPLIFLFI